MIAPRCIRCEDAPCRCPDGAAVYCGDCLEILDRLDLDTFTAGVDAIVTDPPFCSGGYMEAQKAAAKCQGIRSSTLADFRWFSGDNQTTAGLVFLLRAVFTRGRSFLRPNRSALVFTDWRMVASLAPALESAGLRWRNMIVWDKLSAGLGCGFRPAHEIILEYTNGLPAYATKTGQNVLRFPRTPSAKKRHPAEKPEGLLRELIETTTQPGDVILDPFSGSGTVARAAKDLGRRSISIELDPRNGAEIARRLDPPTLAKLPPRRDANP